MQKAKAIGLDATYNSELYNMFKMMQKTKSEPKICY